LIATFKAVKSDVEKVIWFLEPLRPTKAQFDAWLHDALMSAPEKREAALLAWEKAPSARACHPQEDHLIPLMAAVGAAHADKATRTHFDQKVFGNITASSYRFG
jgi:aromatic ring-opening dioxygenase catalytic subunit (LigB family)